MPHEVLRGPKLFSEPHPVPESTGRSCLVAYRHSEPSWTVPCFVRSTLFMGTLLMTSCVRRPARQSVDGVPVTSAIDVRFENAGIGYSLPQPHERCRSTVDMTQLLARGGPAPYPRLCQTNLAPSNAFCAEIYSLRALMAGRVNRRTDQDNRR